jgi:uncharacterized tellurite resistance protein B-like protein
MNKLEKDIKKKIIMEHYKINEKQLDELITKVKIRLLLRKFFNN